MAVAVEKIGMRDGLKVGVALFSMFFGAGNLILMPLLGVQAGPHALIATLGFLLSGVGLPIATISAVARAGSAQALLERINKRFATIFVTLMYLAIGPALAIPRTASTSFAMLEPLLSASVDVAVARAIFSVLFFSAALALALHPTKVVDLMGKLTGPLLIVLLIVVVGSQLIAPAGAPLDQVSQKYLQLPAVAGFIEGYQTLDLLAALAFGYVISVNLNGMGMTDPRKVSAQVLKSGLIAGVLMVLIYSGLGYVGAMMGTLVPDATNGAIVISAAATTHFGTAGTVLVAFIFFLACFNVCTGLITSIGEYFYTTWKHVLPRISYAMWVSAIALVSCLLANVGLDAILSYSVPILMALYPMGIIAMVMGLTPKSESHIVLWRTVMLVTGLVSVCLVLRDSLVPNMWLPLDMLPLVSVGMAWVVPALVAVPVGLLLEKLLRSIR